MRELVSVQKSPLRLQEILPLLLSVAGAAGVAPFAVIRFMDGDLLLAAFDGFVVVSLLSLAIYTYRTRKVRSANVVLAALCVCGMLATVYLRGLGQIYWAYPVMMAVFYLLKPREAITVAALALLGLLPAMLGKLDTLPLTTLFITIWVTTAFAYAFSVLTSAQREELVRMAQRDPLTGAGNRRALTDKLTDILQDGAASDSQTSLVMIDLDHFKAVNDVFGHAHGDQVLVNVTEVIKNAVRGTDSVYRIGGEEFVVVSEGSGVELASRLGEHLRSEIEQHRLIPDRPVTASLGIAELRPRETIDDWLRRADDALYQAKRGGRNRICQAP